MTVDVALIAVFGATGTGKTTFINDASGGNLEVGHGVNACTQEVVQSPCFKLDGRNVVLFDTPGFDDTHLSDTEVLKRIAGFLATTYKNGHKLTGIVYLHRISDNRVGGISLRTFNVFHQLCGKDSLSNVLITTTMWSDPPTETELAREAELRDGPDFFKLALQQGATLARRTHKNTKSAHEIVRMLLKKEPTIMTLQRELVEQGMGLSDTEAGKIVEKELAMATEKHKAEMEQLKRDMDTALQDRDETTQKTLSEMREKAQAEEKQRQDDLESLKKGYGDQQAKWQAEIEKERSEREAAKAQQQALKEELEAARKSASEAAEGERQALQNRVAELENRINSQSDSGICIIC